MIKVAVVQLWHNDSVSKQDRIAHAEQLIESVAGADLILLPEIWNIGWWSFDKYHEESETLEGETISRIAAKAKKLNAYIVAGSIIERQGDALYNTSVLLDRKGEVAAAYRKMHLVHHMGAREAELLKRGEEIVTIETGLGVLGLSTCYDLRFPELFRRMAVSHGVEIFLMVSAWPITRLDHWRELCHVRAIENFCYLIACDMAGIDHGKQYLGHSLIVNPSGISIASAGLYETILKSEIDIGEVYKARELIPAFYDRFLNI